MKLLSTYCKLFFACLFIFSCQKEINFDLDESSGQLLCTPEIAGNYIKGKDLNNNNYIDVPVKVAQAGDYSISTETKNGFSFKAEGKFNDTGTVDVRLRGTGKPETEGVVEFTITYKNSTCNFSVNVQTPVVEDAEYTLINTPNDCLVDSLAGIYVRGLELDTSVSKIFIAVEVTKEGAYNITTDEVNGYRFSGEGILESTGNQVIVLKATGIPLTAQQNSFTVNTGTSSCSFIIDVLDVVEVTGNDYFPLTQGSWWSYEDMTPRGDTMMREIIDTSMVNGIEYARLEERKFGPAKTYKFRKSSGGEYFEYTPVDAYSSSLSYVPGVTDEIYFMNQELFDGTYWESAEYEGTISGGQPIRLKYDFTCLDKNATIVINGKAFTNVYIINVRPEIRSLDHAYNTTGEDYYYHYAKGIGIIYMLKFERGIRQWEWQIKSWDVK